MIKFLILMFSSFFLLSCTVPNISSTPTVEKLPPTPTNVIVLPNESGARVVEQLAVPEMTGAVAEPENSMPDTINSTDTPTISGALSPKK